MSLSTNHSSHCRCPVWPVVLTLAAWLQEYVAFSFLPYFKPGTKSWDSFVKGTISTDDWVLNHSSAGKSAGAVFVEMFSESRNLSVVSIRGTNPKNFFDV
jgi:hypothetical protein